MRIGGDAYIIVLFQGIPKIQIISSSRELNTTNGCQKHQKDQNTYKNKSEKSKMKKKNIFLIKTYTDLNYFFILLFNFN